MSRLMQWPKSSSIKSSTWSHVFHIFSQEYITKLKKPASAHCFLFLIAVEKINVFFDFLFGMLDSFSHQCSDFAERESPRGNGQCTFNAPSRFHNNIITSVRLTGQLQTSSQPAAAFGDDCSRLTISLPFLIVAGKAKQSCPSVGFLVFVGW